MNPKMRRGAAEMLPLIIQLTGIVERDRIVGLQHRDTWPLTRLILRIIQRDEPLIRGSHRGHVLTVAGGHGRRVKMERLHRRLQDQVQQPVQPHLGSIRPSLAQWCIGHNGLSNLLPLTKRRSTTGRTNGKHWPARDSSRTQRTTLDQFWPLAEAPPLGWLPARETESRSLRNWHSSPSRTTAERITARRRRNPAATGGPLPNRRSGGRFVCGHVAAHSRLSESVLAVWTIGHADRS